MKKVFLFILIVFPSLAFAQASAPYYVTTSTSSDNASQGSFIVYVSDSGDKAPLDSARIRIYDDNKQLIGQGYTRTSGYDTIPVSYGQYEVIIDKKHYHSHTFKVDFNYDPKYRNNFYALKCVITRSGVRLNMHKGE